MKQFRASVVVRPVTARLTRVWERLMLAIILLLSFKSKNEVAKVTDSVDGPVVLRIRKYKSLCVNISTAPVDNCDQKTKHIP